MKKPPTKRRSSVMRAEYDFSAGARGKYVKNVKVDSSHPLVGTWVEEENPIDTTTVVYTITAQEERFCVSGMDESDGVLLRISDVSWDREKLHFVSLFPPTHHKACHALQATEEGRANHAVSYSDEYGDHRVDELWKKRLTLTR